MQTNLSSNTDSVDARAFGALATRLSEAVARARDALTPHAAQLPDAVLTDLEDLLAEFQRRRVRIAIYGEVKAGKSTLLNAIAGTQLSPVAFEPLTSVPVRVTYGPDTRWRIGERQLDSVTALEALMREPTHGHNEVVIETNLDLLQLGGQVDVLDTPGVGSVATLDAVSADTLRSLDAVVLVVRYPALFTEYTRQLATQLHSDIGKLFVVWNLDGACAELTPDQRARHAETLRMQVAGAHELLLVDARAGFRAMESGDGSGAIASGLSGLIAALRTFCSSGSRDVAALREAAKCAQRLLAQVSDVLNTRWRELEKALADARARLQATQSKADTDAAREHRRFDEFEATVTRIGDERQAAGAKMAADLRRQLGAAQRRWARRADFDALFATIAAATTQYADAVASAAHSSHEALRVETVRFGAQLAATPRARIEPTLAELSPEPQRQRAATGRWQWLRRRLWYRWYLPGLAELEQTGIAADLAAQAAWWNALASSAIDAARGVRDERLATIARRAASEQDSIKAETNFSANEVEVAQLAEHRPVLGAQAQAVSDIGVEARRLFDVTR
ncbi:MAG TPA: dynamin family protein [Candidatus Binatia bacterium]|nr:dynamin family protein [Candidatus Binatia bacterium]